MQFRAPFPAGVNASATGASVYSTAERREMESLPAAGDGGQMQLPKQRSPARVALAALRQVIMVLPEILQYFKLYNASPEVVFSTAACYAYRSMLHHFSKHVGPAGCQREPGNRYQTTKNCSCGGALRLPVYHGSICRLETRRPCKPLRCCKIPSPPQVSARTVE